MWQEAWESQILMVARWVGMRLLWASRRSKLIVYGRVGSRRRYTAGTKRLGRVISER